MEEKRALYAEDEIITLEFEDGESFECGIMGIFDVDGKDYIALDALDDSNDVYLYIYEPTEDDFELLDIPEEDFDKVCAIESETIRKYFKAHRNMVISMANLLYKIRLDDKERKLLAKSLRKNKEFLESVQMTKKDFDADDILLVERALSHRYKFRAY